VFAFKPFSLSDGAGASERLAGLAVIGIVARVWRAVALHEPSARGEHERNPGLVPVLFGCRFGRFRSRRHARARARRRATRSAAIPYTWRKPAAEVHGIVCGHVGERRTGTVTPVRRLKARAGRGVPIPASHRFEQMAIAFELPRANAAVHAQVVAQEDERRRTPARNQDRGLTFELLGCLSCPPLQCMSRHGYAAFERGGRNFALRNQFVAAPSSLEESSRPAATLAQATGSTAT